MLGLTSASTITTSTVSLATQTCNPLSASTCSADPALATDLSVDFTEESEHFAVYQSPDNIYYGDDGLTLTLAERFDNPSLRSNFYIMFGKVEVLLKSANGTGIISSFYLQSDDLDEIDLEWFGGDGYEVQSNYFSKGNTTTYDRGAYHKMDDPRTAYHNYTIDWTEEALTWYVDGAAVRTLSNDSSSGYPQSPMYLMMGIWAGGDSSNSEGTIEWAGGATDYSDAPFSMYINKLVVVDYSTGTEYTYGDDSGDWTSIKSTDGEINGRKGEAEVEFSKLVSDDDTADTEEDDEDDDTEETTTTISGQSSFATSTTVSTAKRSTTYGGSSQYDPSASSTLVTKKITSKKSKSSESDSSSSSSTAASSSSASGLSSMSNGANSVMNKLSGLISVSLFALALL
ncbi:glycoside hydrolase family 16 protein [[Candida] arabinofermentans NRRL YB-2248]|uniref:Crh-like protein n=1 Tax=[Candida] arabinofermentans NRRL YB-2248 TaxID=983967 RepID=A0A1E4SZD8_9ASCO|nr:glycoside hydrolase family 16 protein [[Candida] arabinofermentans NRRL YB-2248]